MSDKTVSQEIDALVRFYSGRKMIAIKDIIEFSRTYKTINDYLTGTMEEQGK